MFGDVGCSDQRIEWTKGATLYKESRHGAAGFNSIKRSGFSRSHPGVQPWLFLAARERLCYYPKYTMAAMIPRLLFAEGIERIQPFFLLFGVRQLISPRRLGELFCSQIRYFDMRTIQAPSLCPHGKGRMLQKMRRCERSAQQHSPEHGSVCQPGKRLSKLGVEGISRKRAVFVHK